MSRNIDFGLTELNKQLVVMAGFVEQAIDLANQAWRLRQVERVSQVHEIEIKVNQTHKEVDAKCVNLLALQQPFAADLRLVVACLKINNDLERMVDLAVNIANTTEFYLRGEAVVPIGDLSAMSDEVKIMVREVLDAFVNNDENLARNVLHRDDKVDAYNRKIFQDSVKTMQAKSNCVEQGLNVILISKHLERIGDHATNIAEDIIFSISGKDVRHLGSVGSMEGI